MKVRPLGDKVIVKRDEAQSKTDSGIFIPEAAKDKPKQGKIVALGSGILNKDTGKYMPFTVKKGDTVLFTTYSGTEIKIDGETFIITRNGKQVGVLTPMTRPQFARMTDVLEAFKGLPPLSFEEFRRDIDEFIDQDPTPRFFND